MRWLTQLKMRFLMLTKRQHAAEQLEDEFSFHLEQQIAENIASGMSETKARQAALRTFGNPTLLREQTRETWNWNMLESLLRDLRYSVRTLRRTPGFAAMSILVMALGIGANVALFTVVRGVLLKPLPFADSDRLIVITEGGDEVSPDHPVAGGIFEAWKQQSHSFSGLALTGGAEFNFSAGDTTGTQLAESLHGANISANLLPVLGVQPAFGRGFTPADDRREAQGTAILSWQLWMRRFGGNRAILNQTVHLNSQPYTVIGIMPAWFSYPDPTTQLWTPLYHDKPTALMISRDQHEFRAVGRLLPGVSESTARAEISLIVNRIRSQHADDPYISLKANTRPLLEDMVGDIRRPLYVLLAATGCVLLIACLNVANLLVARAAARKKELAIRTALGGSRLRRIRERIVESLLLSTAGGAFGLAFAALALKWLVQARSEMTRVESIHIDATVAAFTIAVVAFCALLSGLISAFSSGDRNILASLQSASRSTSPGQSRVTLRRVLLSLEVGLTVVLLIGAGLLLESYARLRSANLGCITDNVLTMRIMVPRMQGSQPAQLVNFYEQLLDRVRALPGVKAAGFTDVIPGQGYWEDANFSIPEHPALPAGVGLFAINRWVDPGYFNAIGIPILKGRGLDPSRKLDRVDEVVISKLFADKYFPGEDPIGRHLRVTDGTAVYLFRVVGIAGDIRYSLGEDPAPIQYFSLLAGVKNNGSLIVRSSSNVEQLALPIQRIIQSLDRNLPVSDILTMDQLLGRSTVDQSFNATLLVGFAALSLILAAVGLFGVLSYIVAQRTSEIGVRIALGAQREQVLRLVLADGLRPALVGLALGLIAAAGTTRLIQSMLYGTRPLDLTVFTAVSALLLAVAAGACLVPAWRASRLDPVQALRSE
ncbi:ADOP family duplicated permease [Acidicapsa dinghuensis]|uniref:ADOP family duplicated permease n=1 Tax=Acidicapsa dinghuensis TaxID=2218256 RepID=A0ABW1ED13_9BACT|nr:ABC transporter permease [Acidicapsa dinghuensis]